LIQQLPHHQPFPKVQGLLPVVPLVPVGHHQDPPWLQHPQHLLGIAGLVRHVRPCLNGPHHIEAGIGEGQVEGICHLKLDRQIRGGELLGPLHLLRTDGDAGNDKAVVTGQDAAAPTNAAAHIQHGRPCRQPIQPAPAHHLVNKVVLGLQKIFSLGRRAVVA
jgi:hypothetical protein